MNQSYHWITKDECLALHDMMLATYGGSTGLRDDPDGRAVALVDVVRVREWRKEDVDAAAATHWEAGWFAWELENIRSIDHSSAVPARLRIYEIDLPDA